MLLLDAVAEGRGVLGESCGGGLGVNRASSLSAYKGARMYSINIEVSTVRCRLLVPGHNLYGVSNGYIV